jgi:predicted Zn finger-like uncharacterized protein
MAINAVCPDCRAEYTLADQQQGKKVRCKHCDSIFVVGAASAKKAAPVVEVTDRPAAKQRPTAVAAKRAKPTRVTRDDEDEDDDFDVRKPKKGKGQKSGSALPWILGIGGAALVLVAIGVIVLFVSLKDDSSTGEVASSGVKPIPTNQAGPPMLGGQPAAQGGNPVNAPLVAPPIGGRPIGGQPIAGQPVAGQPVAPAANPPKTEVKQADPPAEADDDKEDKNAVKGKLSQARSKRVKRATVFLKVTEASGLVSSGSGFFGSTESPNIVLTNAHVVGMLAPESPRPIKIVVYVNSGESDEWMTQARVLGVDRESDLAVLDIGTPPDGKIIPKPLVVKSAAKLSPLDEVYVFGFPLGEQLGKEITIRPASVSSLRKKNGSLDRIQVNGGMDEGNSGGPVVDDSGSVVGVAVSGYRGRQINFAIPGDRVQMILNGRVADLHVAQPYYAAGGRVAIPVQMEMIDPRHRIKDVALEVWVGDKPLKKQDGHRPASTKQPEPQDGDSPRILFPLAYASGVGTGDIMLPELPTGKVYWRQPKWTGLNGETRWAEASLLELPGDPVERKPATLALHLTPNALRSVRLTIDNAFKVRNNEDTPALTIHTEAGFLEKVQSSNVLNLKYRPNQTTTEAIDSRGQKLARKNFDKYKEFLPNVATLVQLDAVGNIIGQQPDFSALRGVSPQQFKELKDFHETIQQGFDALSVSLPTERSVNPGASWKAERHLPIDVPGKSEIGRLDMTCTYLGVRKYRGHDEAVLHIEGVVRGEKDVGDAVGGRATGTVLVDLASGQTRQTDISVLLELDAVEIKLEDREAIKIKLISLMKMKLDRKLW